MSRKSQAKARFTPQEDTILSEAVNLQGASDWGVIAGWLPGRTARQCRERWTNYVNPVLIHGTWTDTEDAVLTEKYAEFGPKWHVIKGYLKGRSKNSVRNRYFNLNRKGAGTTASRPTPAAPAGAAADQPPTAEAPPKAPEPLAFLESDHDELVILWQADYDPFNHNFFF
jgi:hypothetical protein